MLQGKNAIITGGYQGIGKAIAQIFCENGANVMLVDLGSDEQAAATKAELEALGTRVECCRGDVTDEAFAKEACAKTKELFGSLDILVNNAGITNDKLMARMSGEDFSKVIDVNLKGSFLFMKAACAIMMKQRSGRVINLSSISGLWGNPAQVNYSASKAGVAGMTKAAAKELGRRGITVNALAPGFIDTSMTAVLTDDQKSKAAENISLGRIGTPRDVAGAALFLASDLGAYITGQIIGVDGGLII